MSFDPKGIVPVLYRHCYVLGQLVKRDVLLRYRGAMFGLLWMFLSPLLMLSIFAFIFGQVFQTRSPRQDTDVPFWLLLYCGLIVFNIFAETVSRAPVSVRGYPSYVKKIIFPLDILPIVPLGAALVHGAFNFLILLTAVFWLGNFHSSVVLVPLLLLPAVLLALGLSWFLAAWGVFIKDMTQIVPVFVQMLMFLSPVFYPVNAVPVFLHPIYLHNPLGAAIEAVRAVVTGEPVAWRSWILATILSFGVSLLGYVFFQHTREEFADAL